MSVTVQTVNNVTTFNITALSHHTALPDWLARAHARRLKKDPQWSRRITLLQDFTMPEASLRIKFTPDGRYLIAAGVYKPQVKVFDLSAQSCKFERHVEAETVDMVCLSEDWQKLVLLQADRSIAFHGSGGIYYPTRVPKAGRAMTYDQQTAELLVVGSSNELYRMNLDRGQFMAPLVTDLVGINSVDVAPLHGLIGVAGDGGSLEFWDRRDKNRVAVLQPVLLDDDPSDQTVIRFLPDGLMFAVGDSAGVVRMFDVRRAQPLNVIDHKYGEPIKGIQYHVGRKALISFDTRAIRITDDPCNAATFLTSIVPSVKLNDVASDLYSGFLAAAVEDTNVHAFYCPALGPAPRWASYLENVTEEFMASSSNSPAHYDNYKFVTRDQLDDLGLSHLVGTKVLRAYMHGYFLDQRLYERARAIANPFALEEWQAEQRARKMEAERASRIRADASDKKGIKRKGKTEITDPRFAQVMAEDPDFAVDDSVLKEKETLEQKIKAKKSS